ncbi:hypothetical protein DSO57_1001892 [Entomophthora muscae]|uniref:Uncharacterized protein n=1 Tax=Entomophthora muscae TaxID=34485 RepID=A0ACC2TK94_9FUNG|nr:hypothetical protein DSO57_1001892 [Entomophthora muscae]
MIPYSYYPVLSTGLLSSPIPSTESSLVQLQHWILSAAQKSDSKAPEFKFKEQESKSKEQKSKTKVQEFKTKYKEFKIFLEDSKYWKICIVSLIPRAIYQKVSKGIFLMRVNKSPF